MDKFDDLFAKIDRSMEEVSVDNLSMKDYIEIDPFASFETLMSRLNDNSSVFDYNTLILDKRFTINLDCIKRLISKVDGRTKSLVLNNAITADSTEILLYFLDELNYPLVPDDKGAVLLTEMSPTPTNLFSLVTGTAITGAINCCRILIDRKAPALFSYPDLDMPESYKNFIEIVGDPIYHCVNRRDKAMFDLLCENGYFDRDKSYLRASLEDNNPDFNPNMLDGY